VKRDQRGFERVRHRFGDSLAEDLIEEERERPDDVLVEEGRMPVKRWISLEVE
jgi:hypothetical protein